jgi:hypothetical protein
MQIAGSIKNIKGNAVVQLALDIFNAGSYKPKKTGDIF